MEKRKTKTDKILDHLQGAGSITTWEAISLYRATRLSDIIFRLRNDGHKIITKRLPNKEGGGTYAVYKYVGFDGNYLFHFD